MPFPDSLTLFDRIDVSDSIDMVEKLNQIVAMLDDNTSDLSLIKSTTTDTKNCVTKLCDEDSLAAINDLGWRVLI